jgi:calcineurin-like phosphoesterase family protein
MKLFINPNQKLFFASDIHFFHKNVIKHDNRPFESVEEMNETIIRNWNSVVGEDDIVIYPGDMSFGDAQQTKDIVHRLNGIIYFILGNHDIQKDLVATGRFERIERSMMIRIKAPHIHKEPVYIYVNHFPCLNWDKSVHGSLHVFGHCHGAYNNHPHVLKHRMMDVGVNNFNYTPVEYTYVHEHLTSKEKEDANHHFCDVA